MPECLPTPNLTDAPEDPASMTDDANRSQPRTDDQLQERILSTSGTMEGVCATLIGLVKVLEHGRPLSHVDEYTGCTAVIFVLSALDGPAEKQRELAASLARIILTRQEKDGSWWDYPLYDYGQSYGTGYALMSLKWCRDAMSDPLSQ